MSVSTFDACEAWRPCSALRDAGRVGLQRGGEVLIAAMGLPVVGWMVGQTGANAAEAICFRILPTVEGNDAEAPDDEALEVVATRAHDAVHGDGGRHGQGDGHQRAIKVNIAEVEPAVGGLRVTEMPGRMPPTRMHPSQPERPVRTHLQVRSPKTRCSRAGPHLPG